MIGLEILFHLRVTISTKMAPNYANIFMENFEEHILKRPDKPYLYRRYLDDIFIIWTDTTLKLHRLATQISTIATPLSNLIVKHPQYPSIT